MVVFRKKEICAKKKLLKEGSWRVWRIAALAGRPRTGVSEPTMYFQLKKDKESEKTCQSFDIAIFSEFSKFPKHEAATIQFIAQYEPESSNVKPQWCMQHI